MSSDAAPTPRPMLLRQSSVERAQADYKHKAQESIARLARSAEESLDHFLDRPLSLEGCIFVGHTATDMDSIGSAIGAAELFGGVAARASDINSETDWALKYSGLPIPPPFLDVVADSKKGTGVCLVDHNQASQMTAGVELKSIRGVIDHHALQAGTVVTDAPIYVNIRPWGSACTIVAHMAVSQNRVLSKKTATILLCGILSDTLNLCSPTTTEADKLIVALLAQLSDIDDANLLAQQLFKAKSRDLAGMSCHALLRGDLKRFAFKNPLFTAEIAFGVVETTDLGSLVVRREELLMEMRALKKENGVNVCFLALVDIVRLTSILLVCGSKEADLAVRTFGGEVTAEGVLDLGKRVSRKKDFIPPLSDIMASGWAPPLSRASSLGPGGLLILSDSKDSTANTPRPATAASAATTATSPAAAGLPLLDTAAALAVGSVAATPRSPFDDDEHNDEQFGELYMDCNGPHGCMVKRRPLSAAQVTTTAVLAAARFLSPRSAHRAHDAVHPPGTLVYGDTHRHSATQTTHGSPAAAAVSSSTQTY